MSGKGSDQAILEAVDRLFPDGAVTYNKRKGKKTFVELRIVLRLVGEKGEEVHVADQLSADAARTLAGLLNS